MAPETQPTLTPTEKLFADNPQLARAVQVYWFAQIYFPEEITKTFAMLGVDPHRLALDDPASQRALLAFSEAFFQKYPEENIRAQVEKVVPLDKTVETGLTYAEKIYGEAQRKKFVETLTDNYVRQLKAQGVRLGDESGQRPAIQKEIARRINETLETTTDLTNINKKLEQELPTISGINATVAQAQKAAVLAANQSEKSILDVTNQKNVIRTINNTILRAPAERKDVYAKILTALSIKNPEALTTAEGTAHITQQASELSRVAATLSADIIPDPAKMGAGPEKFFSSYAKTAVQKAAAPAADFLLKFVSPEKQWEIAETFLGKSFDRVMSNTNKLTETLGEEFVGSHLYEYLQSQGRVALVERKGSVSSGMTRTKGLFDDLIGSVITGPIEQRVLGTPDDHMRDILKLNQMGVFAGDTLGTPHPSPPGDGIHTRGATSFSAEFPPAHAPIEITVFVFHARDVFFSLVHRQEAGYHAFEFLKDVGGWIFHWGAKEGTKKVAGEVVKKGATTAAGKWIGGVIGTLFGPGIGTFVGALIGDLLLDKTLGIIGAAWGGLKGFVSFSWILGARGKSEWTDDVALVLAIVSVAFIPILLIYMLLTDVVRNSAYIEAGLFTGIESEEAIVYEGPAPPISVIEGCPVVSTGHISQCPNDVGGSHDPSHAYSNAFDIAVPMGSDVRSTHGGYLVEYVTGLYPGTGSGYGNYVRLVSTDASGKRFFTTYGHLLNVDNSIMALCGGKSVCRPAPGGAAVGNQALLGRVDDTGYSSGAHLHYEVRYEDGGKPQFLIPIGCGGFTGSCPDVQ